MEEFFNQPDDTENIVTPESLAWKLLMDDDVENYAGILLPFVENNTNFDNKKPNVRYDSLADQFQILITIYMEMVFGLLKINHVSSYIDENDNIDESIDLEATFKPDLTNITDDTMTGIFRENFKKIRIFLSVLGVYDSKKNQPKDYGSSSDYYCRIILRDSEEGKTYFRANKDWLDPEKRYTFVMRNDEKKTQKKLEDFYAVCTLPDLKVRLSFSPINVIAKNQHMV